MVGTYPALWARGPGESPEEGPRGFRERVEGTVAVTDVPMLLERWFG
ncbi:MAG: hypothetical protein NYU90_01720 [Aigarchaeota archaeon]|nr:hypothetical protein [Candidatus Calditenuis fumarioli]